jgi:F-type H+-transporting ATPase subunit delta
MAKLSAYYASALFKLAVEGGTENEVLEQAVFLSDMFKDADLKHVLIHPHISAAEKQAFFGRVFEEKLNRDLLSLIYLTVGKNREAYLVPALSELILLIERHQRKTRAKVVSAVEFTQKQLASLQKTLEKKLNKKVAITVKVNPSVIGGPHIQVDGYFIDMTVKRRLSEMKERCGA